MWLLDVSHHDLAVLVFQIGISNRNEAVASPIVTFPPDVGFCGYACILARMPATVSASSMRVIAKLFLPASLSDAPTN